MYKVIMIALALSASFMLYNCEDSIGIEDNKIVTILDSGNANWIDNSAKFSYDTVNFFDGCYWGSHNIIVGSTQCIQFSTNDGATWTQVMPGGILENIIKTTLLKSGKILALSHYNLYQSDDGGFSWNKLFGGQNQLFDIIPINENRLFILGSGKIVFETTDAGISWQKLPDAPEYHGEAVYDGDNSIYILNSLDSYSVFLITTRAYTSGKIGSTDWFAGITYRDDGIIAHSNYTVYLKKDGSNEWVLLYNSNGKYHISDIYFVDTKNGYACFSNTSQPYPWYIMKTTDGGISWQEIYEINNSKSGWLRFVKASEGKKLISGGGSYLITGLKK